MTQNHFKVFLTLEFFKGVSLIPFKQLSENYRHYRMPATEVNNCGINFHGNQQQITWLDFQKLA
jgi:hypothetical protein